MPVATAALGALKKKKLYEGQLEQIEQNITRLTEQQMMLENQRATVSTVAALASAAKASKQTMSEMNIDKIDEVLDNINEQNDQMQQIHDAMANPIGAAADLDEDEMLKELEVITVLNIHMTPCGIYGFAPSAPYLALKNKSPSWAKGDCLCAMPFVGLNEMSL